MVIMDELSRLLEDCERSIDLEHYKKTEALLKKCLRYEETDTVCMKAVYPQDKYPESRTRCRRIALRMQSDSFRSATKSFTQIE